MNIRRIAMTLLLGALLLLFPVKAFMAKRPPLQPGGSGPEAVGVRFEAPTGLPDVAKSKAVAAAKQRLGPIANGASTIQARFVLFSDDQYYSTDDLGRQHFHYQRVPAWVVTFQGVAFPSLGGGRTNNEVTYNSEVHVVIDARNGQYLELFSYR